MSATITAVVVSFVDPTAGSRAVESLLAQSLAPLEVVVVDNGSAEGTAYASVARELPQGVRIVGPGVNLGYTRAANLAAQEAKGEWLFFLNPDAVASKDCLERLLEAVDDDDVAIVGGQVLLPDGRVNAGENPVNIAGVSWSGGYGCPREYGPARDTAAVSGAALLARREAFLELGGLCPYFFMYVDDTDLAWRMRLSGRRVRYCPEAVVVHDYEFDKGPHKWFYLERNRAWALLSNLRLSTLMFLAPLLLATEAVVVWRAFSEGWLREKARAWASLLKRLPQLLDWRRSVQKSRRVSDYWVLQMFSAGVDTPLLDAGPPSWANRAVERYRRVVLGLLEPSAGEPSRSSARRRAAG
ncbi:MAG TPA: glycosyltransferase family 2 protein [Solirubrobacteraceae bacterium]|nr:glycosyltransferase family 2 protein [Solirubrobacteraceae bacterium]